MWTKQHNLLVIAKKIYEKLKEDGRTNEAQRLRNAIDCASEKYNAFSMINMSNNYKWNSKDIVDNLKRSQDQLDCIIRDMKKQFHYDD